MDLIFFSIRLQYTFGWFWAENATNKQHSAEFVLFPLNYLQINSELVRMKEYIEPKRKDILLFVESVWFGFSSVSHSQANELCQQYQDLVLVHAAFPITFNSHFNSAAGISLIIIGIYQNEQTKTKGNRERVGEREWEIRANTQTKALGTQARSEHHHCCHYRLKQIGQ